MATTTTTTTSGNRSTTKFAAAAKPGRGKRNLPTEEEQQLPPDASSSAYSDICTYWAPKPAFDTQSVLLRRLFLLNASKTKYVSFGFYPSSVYLPSVEFGFIRSCGSKAIILTDEQFYTLAQILPAFADSMCREL